MRFLTIVLISIAIGAQFGHADSLFKSKTAKEGSLVSTRRPQFEAGDIITVIVNESTNATTQATTDTEKESTLETEIPEGGINFMPKWDIDFSSEHEGSGQTRRSSKLSMTISCIVQKVSENGNIAIKGEKSVTVNREDCTLHVSGIIRAKDVSPDNTILSSRIANADIRLKGHGPIWNAQRRGILTRILDWFSPF